MIIRILIAAFTSFVGGICYLTGLSRLMNALLLSFGGLMSIFLGAVFLLPTSEDVLGFPVYGKGGSWPFFVLAVILFIMAGLQLILKRKKGTPELLGVQHGKFLIGGFFGCLTSIFLPAFFWFPSEEKRVLVEQSSLAVQVLIGTCFFILCLSGSLYLLYRAGRGGTEYRPDFMQRVVLALFAIFQLDKIPAFIAYLLIYSPETQIIFPGSAAFALAAYIPVGVFLWYVSAAMPR